MKRRNLFLIGGIMSIALFIGSCTKDAVTEPATDTNNNGRMTLSESVADKGAVVNADFLLNSTPIDNSDWSARYSTGSEERAIWRRYPWDISIGYGCIGCFGMCSSDPTDPFGGPVRFPYAWASIRTNAVGGVLVNEAGEQKLEVIFRPEVCECAFTADGLFPVEREIVLSPVTCDIFELPHGARIGAGVYVASANADSGSYESVVLDLVF